MFFRRFNFATSPVGAIDTLLAALPTPPAPSSTASVDGSLLAPLPPADLAQYEATLDALLATPDLLTELKAGANPRLVDFLARAEVVQRLGGWIVWGLGGEQEEDVPSGGIIADDVEDGKVPDIVVAPGEKKAGLGGVPRRRDMDEMGVLEGGEPETEQEKNWAPFPRLATEILASDTPSLATILYNPATVSSQPHTCPSPRAFLEPFWEALLRSTELQLETRSVQVGYWARVNGYLLGGAHGGEILSQILAIPHLLPRLLTLLPCCSPINDLLLLMLRLATTTTPSPLLNSLVPSTLRMLDPYNSLGKPGHVAAEELLRGVIELCSAAPASGLSSVGGPPGGGGQMQDGPEWRENSLARQLADERAVKMMVTWMLAGLDNLSTSDELPVSPPADDPAPRVGVRRLPPLPGPDIDDLRTSSLIQSISVLVDLIRKNNSDFVEQQMLAWARAKELKDNERELLEADSAEVIGQPTTDAEVSDSDRGPSLVHLGALLATVAQHLGGLQLLVKNPRSFNGPILTSVGPSTPLTLERFRICEFYAELLHCSNMSLLNRPARFDDLYDRDGYLVRGWRSADELNAAINRGPSDDDQPPSPPPVSARSIDDRSTYSYSSISTASIQGSLDSEPGIVTAAEAKELRDLVAASDAADVGEDSEEGDPFGDPTDADLVEVTEALDLDDDLQIREPPESLSVPSSPPQSPTKAEGSSTADAPSARSPKIPSPLLPTPRPVVNALSPGPFLKRKFMEHHVIETMLDLFFDFPWNNFLHNVVFDILQQIFRGRIDRELDRELAVSVFIDGRLVDRILAGQAANDAAVRTKKVRLGYMGHMSLIAEEVVKLFLHYPNEIHAFVQPHIPQAEWDHYVETTLRQTRDRDLAQLGGGISIGPHDTSSIKSASALSDDDDEFPSARALSATTPGGSLGGPATPEGLGAHIAASLAVDEGEPGASDRFSRYLATAISSDRPDKLSSDEDEDEDAGWLGGSRFDPGDVDFALGESSPSKAFAFDDQFASPKVFRTSSPDSDDDTDWGPFATDRAAPKPASFGADDFRPTESSAGGFESSFGEVPFDNFVPGASSSTGAFPDDDDFGEFSENEGHTVLLPSLNSLEDFDFDEDGRTSSFSPSTPPVSSPTAPAFRSPRPVFARTATADDGSALFGGISSFDDGPISPVSPRSTRASPFGCHSSLSPPSSPSVQADLATSLEAPLGPSMHDGSFLTTEGLVQTTVEGKVVRVPADEIALAHRRSSIDEMERPVLDEGVTV